MTSVLLPLKGTKVTGAEDEHVTLDGLNVVDDLVTDLATANNHLTLDLVLHTFSNMVQ